MQSSCLIPMHLHRPILYLLCLSIITLSYVCIYCLIDTYLLYIRWTDHQNKVSLVSTFRVVASVLKSFSTIPLEVISPITPRVQPSYIIRHDFCIRLYSYTVPTYRALKVSRTRAVYCYHLQHQQLRFTIHIRWSYD